ncbi:pyridoxamine 5'-phosphate oxidase family protein [Actinomadura hibisca]|uniref:pyridoxamine 5'-phosphate oxidase family protein n=1 Tax=Actinomadura hibisca TaxID=68565 RepID=UPI00082ED4F0|nr:pyridoxamine 5'-phosphate oxidase family protein [Actinomadura hibisca]
MGKPVLEELDRAECLRLVAGSAVGRVAFDDGEGPAIIPVNYVLDGDTLVFRTTVGGRLTKNLSTHLAGAEMRIAFEVDRLDTDDRTGWSVLLRGGARPMTEQEAAAAPDPDPWPAGERESLIVFTPNEVSGRRLHRD